MKDLPLDITFKVLTRLSLRDLFRMRAVSLQWRITTLMILSQVKQLSICPEHYKVPWNKKDDPLDYEPYDSDEEDLQICLENNNIYVDEIEKLNLKPTADMLPNLTHLVICSKCNDDEMETAGNFYNFFIEKCSSSLEILDLESMYCCTFRSRFVMPNLKVFRTNHCDYDTLHHIMKTSPNLEEIILNQSLVNHSGYVSDDDDDDAYDGDDISQLKSATNTDIKIEECINIPLPRMRKLEMNVYNKIDLVRMIPCIETMTELSHLSISGMDFYANMRDKFWVRIFRSLKKLKVIQLNGRVVGGTEILKKMCPQLDTKLIEIDEWD